MVCKEQQLRTTGEVLHRHQMLKQKQKLGPCFPHSKYARDHRLMAISNTRHQKLRKTSIKCKLPLSVEQRRRTSALCSPGYRPPVQVRHSKVCGRANKVYRAANRRLNPIETKQLVEHLGYGWIVACGFSVQRESHLT